MKLSTIRPLIRSLILRTGYILVRFIEQRHAVRLMKLLAQVKLDVLKRMQTASGMAQLATAIHLVLGTEIRLHAKQLHIIPVAAEIM